jgi:carboxymethylenebutenolidase
MGDWIKLTASDGFALDAYEAKPTRKPRGGIVLIQEIFGVNAHIRKVADDYAREGYHVISPAIFDRAESHVDLDYQKQSVDKGIAPRARIPAEQTLLDVAAAIAALTGDGKVAIVGYCYGGSLAWLGATRLPGLAAAVGYYGGMVAKHLDEKPRCPVMLHFGEKDTGIPMSDVAKIRAATDPARVEVFTYPSAGHAFNREGNQAYEAESAKLALSRSLGLLRDTVG